MNTCPQWVPSPNGWCLNCGQPIAAHSVPDADVACPDFRPLQGPPISGQPTGGAGDVEELRAIAQRLNLLTEREIANGALDGIEEAITALADRLASRS